MPADTTPALKCLWMNLRTSVHIDEIPTSITRNCELIRTTGFDEAAVIREAPDFIVLEFDYPSRQDLARAATFKDDFSRFPMVAVSVQHSEALALWFFRARFYDVLVRPLATAEVANCLTKLKEVNRLRAKQETRTAAQVKTDLPSEATSVTSFRTRLKPALTMVERNYHQRLRVTDAADKCGLPPFRFGREFKETFGMDFRDFVLRYRIREACRLLRNPKASITEVGYSVGFSEPSYFTKMFKKFVGRCPSDVVGTADLDYAIDVDVVATRHLAS